MALQSLLAKLMKPGSRDAEKANLSSYSRPKTIIDTGFSKAPCASCARSLEGGEAGEVERATFLRFKLHEKFKRTNVHDKFER